jgi:hypothetical protein
MTTTQTAPPLPGRRPLLAAAAASLAIGVLHVLVPIVGAAGYRFFGAPSLALEVERGSVVRPAVLTLAFAALFAIWGLYAASAAGHGRRLPLTRSALLAIGTIYTLRGLFLIPQLLKLLQRAPAEPRLLAFSAASLLIGTCYLVGVTRAWGALAERGRHVR